MWGNAPSNVELLPAELPAVATAPKGGMAAQFQNAWLDAQYSLSKALGGNARVGGEAMEPKGFREDGAMPQMAPSQPVPFPTAAAGGGGGAGGGGSIPGIAGNQPGNWGPSAPSSSGFTKALSNKRLWVWVGAVVGILLLFWIISSLAKKDKGNPYAGAAAGNGSSPWGPWSWPPRPSSSSNKNGGASCRAAPSGAWVSSGPTASTTSSWSPSRNSGACPVVLTNVYSSRCGFSRSTMPKWNELKAHIAAHPELGVRTSEVDCAVAAGSDGRCRMVGGYPTWFLAQPSTDSYVLLNHGGALSEQIETVQRVAGTSNRY